MRIARARSEGEIGDERGEGKGVVQGLALWDEAGFRCSCANGRFMWSLITNRLLKQNNPVLAEQ